MNRDSDRYWLGIFYCNRDDPHLMVPKRYGWGWTFNYGHPTAWILTFGGIVAIAAIAYLSTR